MSDLQNRLADAFLELWSFADPSDWDDEAIEEYDALKREMFGDNEPQEVAT